MKEPPQCRKCIHQADETKECFECRHYDLRVKWMLEEELK